MDVVHGDALESRRADVLTGMALLEPRTRQWLVEQTGHEPDDEQVWRRALTHGSAQAGYSYERLEFLGDRVLGLSIAEWLFRRNSGAEGTLSQRLNALVSRKTCAGIARQIGLGEHVEMGKQARSDGGIDSDNILGDVIESLIGACFIDHGFDAARAMVRRWWDAEVSGTAGTMKHPKSALQEWAAGNNRKPPEYTLLDRSGPDHASRFVVRVSVHRVGAADGDGDSKQAAETAAAEAFLIAYG